VDLFAILIHLGTNVTSKYTFERTKMVVFPLKKTYVEGEHNETMTNILGADFCDNCVKSHITWKIGGSTLYKWSMTYKPKINYKL
jgi:hypothetical protein